MDKVVISTMALGTLPPEWAGWKLIEWAGKPTGGAPGWSDYAQGLRDRASGRLLPNLLKNYRLDPDSMVVPVGFSAGSNSGLREILRNAADRAQVVAAVAIDGAHWNQKKPGTSDPAQYWDWKGEAGPFDEMAKLALSSGKPFVATASQVGRPGTQLSMTREALQAVATDLGAPKAAAPDAFTGSLTGTVKGQTMTKSPVESFRQGGFVVSLWPGNQPNDHIWQAQVLVPQALAYLRSQGIT